MNILDESTKAMLDAGSTAVLNGGYLVMTPETFKRVVQTASITAVDMLSDVILEQPPTEETNDSSICSMCGGYDIAGTACSSLILETGYGSANDMERVTIPLCGECADRLYMEMIQMLGSRIDDIQL